MKKTSRRLLRTAVCIMLTFMLLSAASVHAAGVDFDSMEISDKVQYEIWNNIALTEEEIPQTFDSPLVSFDISEDGQIAVATNSKKIIIMNTNGNIIRCFSFESSGSYFIQWKNDNLLLILVRGSVIAEFTSNGDFISVQGIDESGDNTIHAWNLLKKSTLQTYNNEKYQVKNDMGLLNIFTSYKYSQLVKTDEKGNSFLLYDATENHEWTVLIIVCWFCLLFGGGTAVLIVKIRKSVCGGEQHGV